MKAVRFLGRAMCLRVQCACLSPQTNKTLTRRPCHASHGTYMYVHDTRNGKGECPFPGSYSHLPGNIFRGPKGSCAARPSRGKQREAGPGDIERAAGGFVVKCRRPHWLNNDEAIPTACASLKVSEYCGNHSPEGNTPHVKEYNNIVRNKP